MGIEVKRSGLGKYLGKPPRSKKKIRKGKRHGDFSNKKKKNPYVADYVNGIDRRLYYGDDPGLY